MGKEYPYFALWRLLEPQLFSTPQAFEAATPEIRAAHFIRRTKEEMVTLQGTPLYPMRCSSTLSYELSDSERELYDATTDYLLYIYNQAQFLNRTASQLALSVFQRRLASSAWALLRSMERRAEKISNFIARIEANEITEEQLFQIEKKQEEDAKKLPGLYVTPTDEDISDNGMEPDEKEENNALENMVATSLSDLYYERNCVLELAQKARAVYESGDESKFEKLREVIESPEYAEQKLLVFTEHKDTLEFLTQRLEALGYTGRIAFIHGGLGFEERQEQIAFFRRTDGARIMLCTDAAAEGVNLQLDQFYKLFTPRQLLALGVFCKSVRKAMTECLDMGYPQDWAEAIGAYLTVNFDKLVDYNSTICHCHRLLPVPPCADACIHLWWRCWPVPFAHEDGRQEGLARIPA